MMKKVLESIRNLGLIGALLFATSRLLQSATRGKIQLRAYWLAAQSVPPRPKQAKDASSASCTYVATQPDDVLEQANRPLQVLTSRFRQGASCVVRKTHASLVGFVWLCPSPYHEDEVNCVYTWLPEDKARWDFDVYIAPRYRMTRAFARIWNDAQAHLAASGVEWTLSRIDAFNSISMASHRRLGARKLGWAWFLTIGHIQLSLLSMRPYLHFTTLNGRPLQIRLQAPCLEPAATLHQ